MHVDSTYDVPTYVCTYMIMIHAFEDNSRHQESTFTLRITMELGSGHCHKVPEFSL